LSSPSGDISFSYQSFKLSVNWGNLSYGNRYTANNLVSCKTENIRRSRHISWSANPHDHTDLGALCIHRD
jgi:hypothetical protein